MRTGYHKPEQEAQLMPAMVSLFIHYLCILYSVQFVIFGKVVIGFFCCCTVCDMSPLGVCVCVGGLFMGDNSIHICMYAPE